ncbi:GNAT family N-acetyltransferase [Ichthyenterobacterium sp. W332]|uniref:GNAT family N-acetyltransferase n=1 Tax=Microcosmobacter mediterraneus TaxID=3075607 RepID=A0ABU2YKN1_9FLAO|nr:GNAT family N-acetyltransferase [Ichthyenterobacterium sp. W332]MDT0558726.1 GNAT family N-acetyltransferase [Ichthyenterobacterium sp. W332]
MVLKVYILNDIEEANAYNTVLEQLDNKHPYYKVAFLDIFYDGLDNARAVALFDTNEKPLVTMPFYLRPIESTLVKNELFFDVTSTWGYSGPLYNDDISELILNEFWSLVDSWYQNNNVVTEFLRFNTTNNTLGYNGQLVTIMNIVKGNLTTPEDIWNNYNRKVRKNINKAKRAQLYTKVHDNITDQVFDDFYKIFVHTMDRTEAKSQYYNSSEKLKLFFKAHSNNAAIALTYNEDSKAISSEIVLLSNHTMFSFIGGTLSEYFNQRPNEDLKNEVIKWGINKGFKYYVLGGGLGKEDGIFNYKKAFFPENTVPFITGRKILNKEIYNVLCSAIKEEDITDDFFPLYRLNV